MAEKSTPQQQQQQAQQQEQQDKSAPTGASQSQDPNIGSGPELDPTKVVGTYAEQPDPNDERPAPQPNIPEGVNEAPGDDAEDAGQIGQQGGYGEKGDPAADVQDPRQ